jgi:recombination protein RecA
MDIETGGGFPKSRIVEIYGGESSGKTYVSLCTVASAQKTIADKTCLWIDMEGVFDPIWAQKVGVNLDRLEIAKPETAEDAGTILDAGTRSNAYSVIVLDSVAAMLPKEDLDKAMDDPERIGNRAMTNNRIIRKVQSALNAFTDSEAGTRPETLLILINQVREDFVAYGNPETTPGGRGIPFAASIRIEMRRGDLIKEKPEDGETGQTPDGKMIIGVTLKFKTVKNKTYTPLKTGQFILLTSREKLGQVDHIDEIIRYAVTAGIIKRSGPSYAIGEHKLLGMENLREYIEENKLIEKLYEEIKSVYR